MSETWTPDRVRSVFESVKNWGRWGANDERGSLNYITPAKLREAGEAIRAGRQVSCARELAVHPGIDNPRLLGKAYLEPDEWITLAQIEAAEAAQGVRVGEGDVLLVETGRDARRAKSGPTSPMQDGMAGMHPECANWLHERRVAVLGSDGVSDPLPGVGIEGWGMPLHQCTLVAMGVHLLDNLRLDRLCAAGDEQKHWTFQFVVAPLRVEMGTGSPVNPIAIL